ncbi:MAG TPA: methylmalonyl Co-A mutase-associated GTPase MeaB [Dehalococcoidia bacterium]
MPSENVERLLAGDKRSLSRVLSWVENNYPEGREAMRELYSHTGRAHIIGITGTTGCGKSTLTGALAREYRKQDKTIGIVAIDPTSPFSHGAILGDRIRMQDLTSDAGVFIRSMATRGALGGLAATTNDIVNVMDAAGKELIIVETVGAGQDEVEIAGTAHTTIVVNIPGAGDDMQAIKAGILEIADVLVVNKADLPQADAVFKQLHIYTDLQRNAGWNVPIVKTIAYKDKGIDELMEAIGKHREFLGESGRLDEMLRERGRRQLLATAQSILMARVTAGADASIEELAERIAAREIDPRTAAEQLIAEAD